MSKKKNALELAGGVAALIALAAILSFAFSKKAHAISEGYRQQLQREHKTQVQDATGAAKPAAYKPGTLPLINIKKNGVEFKRSRDGFAYINGSAAAKDEDNADATVYSGGLYIVTVYKRTGKITLMKNGQFVGRLR